MTKIAATLPTLLEEAAAQDLSYSAFLSSVLRTEVASKQEKHHTMRVQMARFPFHKTLDGFDWKAQPSIEPKVIKELATMRFVANGANAPARAPRCGQDAPERRARDGSVSARAPGRLHHGGGADHDARQSAL